MSHRDVGGTQKVGVKEAYQHDLQRCRRSSDVTGQPMDIQA